MCKALNMIVNEPLACPVYVRQGYMYDKEGWGRACPSRTPSPLESSNCRATVCVVYYYSWVEMRYTTGCGAHGWEGLRAKRPNAHAPTGNLPSTALTSTGRKHHQRCTNAFLAVAATACVGCALLIWYMQRQANDQPRGVGTTPGKGKPNTTAINHDQGRGTTQASQESN